MKAVNVNQALDLLSSDRLKDRLDGLGDLKHILLQNKRASNPNLLDDNGYHKIFDALFRFVSKEKLAFNRASKPGPRSTAASRLSTCGSVIRAAAELSSRIIRSNTVIAVIYHITDVLETPGEGLWEHLSSDYIKTLRIFLQFPPHVEHLSKNDWNFLVDFCLRGIGIGEKKSESQLTIRSGRLAPGSAVDRGSRAGSTDPKPSQRNGHVDSKSNSEELELCIQLLVSSPMSPVLDAHERLLHGLTEYLSPLKVIGRTPYAAFSAINTILTRSITEDILLARETIYGLLSTIRRFWSSKSAVLKDEMLLTLMIGRDILITSPDLLEDLPIVALQTLVEHIHEAYTSLPERDMLQVDDLTFAFNLESAPLAIGFMAPRLSMSKSVQTWVTLSSIASLSKVVDDFYHAADRSSSNNQPKKRQQLMSRIDDVFREISSATTANRICALQLVPFLVSEMNPEPDRLSSMLSVLSAFILDENQAIASWAMIALASIAGRNVSKLEVFKARWLHVWDLTSRTLPSLGSSRAGCVLLSAILHHELLGYVDIVNSIEQMISTVDLNGPATITDSALNFWAILMDLRSKANPAHSQDMAKQICGWLRTTWTTGPVPDRLHASQIAWFARPLALMGLLIPCTGRPLASLTTNFYGPSCRLAHALMSYNQQDHIIQYLVLSRPQDRFQRPGYNSTLGIDVQTSTRSYPNDSIVLDLLQTRVDTFSQTWKQLFLDNSIHATAEIVQILVSLCTINYSFLGLFPFTCSRSESLKQGTDTLWKSICEHIAQNSPSIQWCLDVLAPLMLWLKLPLSSGNIFLLAVSKISAELLPLLTRLRETGRSETDLHTEEMELDSHFPPQNSTSSRFESIAKFNREDNNFLIFGDSESIRIASTIQLSLLGEFLSVKDPLDASKPISSYLETWDEVDILVGWPIMTNFLDSQPHITRKEVCNILEYFGESCLQDYQLNRCEASICACIALMTCFVELWTSERSDNLEESATDLYIWFINVLLEKGVGTSRALIRLAELLRRVLSSNAAFLRESQYPSPRTSLFKILCDGDLIVKFYISDLISGIFSGFILKEHDAIFDDVLDSLPRDREWSEGIALRLVILARLASQWHTLLRRSIYHIFETPGQVPSSSAHAKVCLEYVSKELGLPSAKSIFKLFSSQVVYTWIETQSVSRLPYAVFGYATLKDLLMDIQDEVIAQLSMRVKEEDFTEVSNCLGVSAQDLLTESFSRAEAYSIARDISIPPSQDPKVRGSESGMKKLLGPDRFLSLVERTFPEIVAAIFNSMDQTEQIERAFAKRPHLQPALRTLDAICERGSSNDTLPIGQQPSFRAKYLLDELEFLCKRTGYDPDTMWTPALTTFVARELIQSIHPALGSFHTCSVIRKLRVLVCIAGPVALQGYPYELLLHCLRAFLTDFQCSADTIGLFWYLIDKGRMHLSFSPSFLAGLAVSTLASLKVLLSSKQESTTPEADFQEIMSKAQSFHQWFSGFLLAYKAIPLTEDEEKSLRRVIQSAQRIWPTNNISPGTCEVELMLELLQDKVSGRSLLSSASFDLVFTQLCQDFRRPDGSRDDLLDSDQFSFTNMPGLWESLKNPMLSSTYKLWVARVLGRSYSATGVISDFLLKEQRVSFPACAHDSGAVSSKVSILNCLCDCLFSNDRQSVGLAERTLQVILNGLTKKSVYKKCESAIPGPIMKALLWAPYHCPKLALRQADTSMLDTEISWSSSLSVTEFAKNLSIGLCFKASNDPVIGALPSILFSVPALAVQLLPYILHDVLLLQTNGNSRTRQLVSLAFQEAFSDIQDAILPHIRLMIYCILYLRYQPLPSESTMDERDNWLDINFLDAAYAATRCRMYKTALLFVEIHFSHIATTPRRTSTADPKEGTELLHDIYSNIDNPDMFYGIQQEPSIESVLGKLSHESSGLKNLEFQSANYDANMRLYQELDNSSAIEVVKALNSTNLHGIANVMLQAPGIAGRRPEVFDNTFSTALSLQQWDIPVPTTASPIGNLFKAFQGLNIYEEKAPIVQIFDECFLSLLDRLSEENQSFSSLKETMQVLGILSDIDEIVLARSCEEVEGSWERILVRNQWLKLSSFRDIGRILSSQEGIFSAIRRKPHLRNMLNLTSGDARLLEVKAIRESLKITREHDARQASLKSAMSLAKLIEPCAELGVRIDAAATFDLANVLWDQGEMTTSINMLQRLSEQKDTQEQSIPVNRAEILASLGHHIAEARLENPDMIIEEYLIPAIKDLKGQFVGEEAGLAFHEFAAFCDQQLQNPDMLEDFHRIEQIRHRKYEEVMDFEKMIDAAEGKQKDQLKLYRNKAKVWFDLDDREYQRLKRSRELLLEQSLESYLMSLKACDTFSNDLLRFCALWLDNSDSEFANRPVNQHLPDVPSRKFVPLMTQLTSRLSDAVDSFQPRLFELVFRICMDHPFHGMYQIFASSKSKGGNDQQSLSRFNAAGKVVERLKNDRIAGPVWVAIHNTNISYVRFAMERMDEKVKTGSKVPLKKSPTGQRLEQDIARQRIPPPTMKIELRADRDYSEVPRLIKFLPEFSVASGVSAPKIVTAVASDGLQYKQLFKGGNDDLRQDAIMEQVFEQVSNVLKSHRATQQRNLGIRTYRVVPLTANAGIIEFVQNTLPLHDYLMPAHQKHFPRGMKPNLCRKHISDAQSKSLEQRVKVYRNVAGHFHPVMRYFFMEKFQNPDDWFGKRLAYTQSTAAISILGHVLGLGDRHGHNILLDEATGEVVHIDLGVAFEQGRVLPVPEVVPFRLTRDLVDGMGISGTEGVFRRCCEFTLEALREESYRIMTILDVLRYDPLYSWSLSPVRMKKMQDLQEASTAAGGGGATDAAKERRKGASANEASEADRALTVVAKKLSKTLSVAATVNELIQQATDEKNLAVLYCGWAAYA